MTVIVEPDDLSAWVGLVGVVVGVLATGGVTFVQGAMRDRKDRRQELLVAIGQVRGAGAVFNMTVGAGGTVGGLGNDRLGGLTEIKASLDRLQRAASIVIRLGPPNLVMAAAKTMNTAEDLATATAQGVGYDPLLLTQALRDFSLSVNSAGSRGWLPSRPGAVTPRFPQYEQEIDARYSACSRSAALTSAGSSDQYRWSGMSEKQPKPSPHEQTIGRRRRACGARSGRGGSRGRRSRRRRRARAGLPRRGAGEWRAALLRSPARSASPRPRSRRTGRSRAPGRRRFGFRVSRVAESVAVESSAAGSLVASLVEASLV
jgi:hypothetical protein